MLAGVLLRLRAPELLSLSRALPRHYEIISRVLLQLLAQCVFEAPQWAQVRRGPGQAVRPDRLQGLPERWLLGGSA